MYLRILMLLVGWYACINAYGQFGNDRPDIVAHRELNSNEDEPITLQLTDLTVIDRDDTYPDDFTLTVYEGDNYSVSGTTVTPEKNFSGNLRARVSVNDGQAESRRFSMWIFVRPVNDPPEITGQETLVTNEEEAFTLRLAHLKVNDPDDNYPDGFSLEVLQGSNYSTSGHNILPAKDFTGELSVQVRVNDGESNSNVFNLQLQVNPVNDAPVITGHTSITAEVNEPVSIYLSHLKVSDPDNNYPDDFTLLLDGGTNYTLSGNTIVPSQDFEGTLQVNVRVNDGRDNSAPYAVPVEVKRSPAHGLLQIIGQQPLQINEDASITLTLSDLELTDPENNVNNRFFLTVLEDNSYSVTGTTITPSADFNGDLYVKVALSNGKNTGAPFDLLITVVPVNDPPLVELEPETLSYEVGNGSVLLTDDINITDVDSDTLFMAEISFTDETYRPGNDRLLFANTEDIRGAFNEESGILFLVGNASLNEYMEAIGTLEYNYVNTEETSFETKVIHIIVRDGESTSEPAERKIRLTPIPLEIPNGFTPNGDRANDTWKIKPMSDSERFSKSIIKVYDKRGVLVFEAIGLDSEWDGKFNGQLLPVDTYYYTIDLNLNNAKATYSGAVTIIR